MSEDFVVCRKKGVCVKEQWKVAFYVLSINFQVAVTFVGGVYLGRSLDARYPWAYSWVGVFVLLSAVLAAYWYWGLFAQLLRIENARKKKDE
ncbi:MAG: hypothetical protein CMP11_04175 [Zetaproteobacteria bacterium]|nr:hypothetical protein [Pseudobdellovibrionaceae bacterium]